MKENYMVVELPKNGDTVGCEWLQDPAIFEDYDKAFDCLNEKLSDEGQQLFKRPRLNVPIRVSLSHREVELWIIRREEKLSTN